MANFSQNNVNFTIADNFTGSEKNHPIKGKLTSVVNDYLGYEGDDASKLINAVDIDWNSAAFKSAVDAITTVPDNGAVQDNIQNITATGELMKSVYSPMFAKVA